MGATESFSEAVERGRAAIAHGGWEEARAAFGEARERSDSAEAWEGLSWAASWLEDGAGAIEAREHAYRLYKDAADSRTHAQASARRSAGPKLAVAGAPRNPRARRR